MLLWNEDDLQFVLNTHNNWCSLNGMFVNPTESQTVLKAWSPNNTPETRVPLIHCIPCKISHLLLVANERR